LGISQSAYVKVEQGLTVLKIDRLQQIAEVLGVDISTLLNTTAIFDIVLNSTTAQNGYITTKKNENIDIELIRKIVQEEINKKI
jgi:transcriptional regulator with XRE-family HTH domain